MLSEPTIKQENKNLFLSSLWIDTQTSDAERVELRCYQVLRFLNVMTSSDKLQIILIYPN